MVREARASILPTRRHNSEAAKVAFDSEIENFKKSFRLDRIELESIQPSYLIIVLFNLIIVAQFFLIGLLVYFIGKSGEIPGIINLSLMLLTLVIYEIISMFSYKLFFNVNENVGVIQYLQLVIYSLNYLPFASLFFVLATIYISSFLGGIIIFIASMLSVFFLESCLLPLVEINDTKSRFIGHLLIFFIQYTGFFLITEVLVQVLQ
ncbi:hypothetical protein TCON_1263 [Astathelohania contejeani]|uniref:Uncharacterized protein n=1 Tax=Astathelohania contejeani TaxID=164912 RepID=A0ABQ7HZE8_9MICR|nr:hypothetical protein TCON_1263 [Thelohania contejeani]